MISIVRELPYGNVTDEQRDIVKRNLALIKRRAGGGGHATGDAVARTLLDVTRGFGVRMLFLRSGSVAEELLRMNPPFDVVVVGSE